MAVTTYQIPTENVFSCSLNTKKIIIDHNLIIISLITEDGGKIQLLEVVILNLQMQFICMYVFEYFAEELSVLLNT